MKSITVSLVVLLGSGLLLVGCARMPEKLVSPTVKIEPVVQDNKEMFKLTIGAGIQNENSDIAFIDMKGSIVFKDGGARVLAIPFTLPVVLPFDTGIIEAEKICTEDEIKPLLTLFGSDKEKLLGEKVLERSFVDEKNIGFELAGCEKKNILDVLKEKVNEKNR